MTEATPDLADRRAERRYPVEAAAEVLFLDYPHTLVTEAYMVDVSKCGLRVRLPVPVRVGSQMRIRFGKTLVFAEVRWCRTLQPGTADAGLVICHTMAETVVEHLHRAARGPKQGRAQASGA